MSVFKTERPKDINESINNIVALKNRRKQALLEAEDAKKADDESKDLKKQLDDMDTNEEERVAKENAVNMLINRRAKEVLARKKAVLENKLVNIGTEELFNQIIFEMTYDSYWMDDSIKEKTNIMAMYESFNNTLDTVKKLYKPAEESIMIKNMKEVVLEVCKKAAKRIAEEMGDEIPDTDEELSFSLNDEEEMGLDDELNDLGKDQIEQMVKDKVLSVIQDEQRASQEKAQVFKEMDEKMTELKAEADAKNEELPEDGEGEETTNTTAEESLLIQTQRNFDARIRKSYGSTLFDAIMSHSSTALGEDMVTEGISVSPEDKANAVFADTVYTYTVLEVLNTLGIYKFNNTNIEPLIKEFTK